MRIKFFETPVTVPIPSAPAQAAPKLDKADRYNEGGRAKVKTDKPSGGLGVMSFLTAGFGGGASIEKSALQKLEALPKQLRQVQSERAKSWEDKKKLAALSKRETALYDEMRSAFATWCEHADWTDAATVDRVVKGRLPFKPSATQVAHLMDTQPATFLRVMLSAARVDPSYQTMDWGSFLKAPDPRQQVARLEGLTECGSFGKVHGLDFATRPFMTACAELMDDPAWQPRLLSIAPLLFAQIEKAPEVLEALVGSRHSDSGRGFLNAFFGAYLNADTPKEVETMRTRIAGLPSKVSSRLPMEAVVAALHAAEAPLAIRPAVDTSDARKAAVVGLGDKDPKIRSGANQALQAWAAKAPAAELHETLASFVQTHGAGPNVYSIHGEQKVLRAEYQALSQLMLTRLSDLDALSPKQINALLKAMPTADALSHASIALLLKAGGPKVWTANADVLKNSRDARPLILETALSGIALAKGKPACDAWMDLAVTVGRVGLTSSLDVPLDRLVELADLGNPDDLGKIARFMAAFAVSFPADRFGEVAAAGLEHGATDAAFGILRCAKNRGALEAAVAQTAALTDDQRIDFALAAEGQVAALGGAAQVHSRLSEPIFREVASKVADGGKPSARLTKLHALLAAEPGHRMPVWLVDELVGIPKSLRTADPDKDLSNALKQVRDEKTRFVAIARVREVLLGTKDAATMQIRFDRVVGDLDRVLGFRSWLRGGKRAQADLDAQQMFTQVLQPAFSHLAQLTDVADEASLDRLVKTSTHLKKHGAVFTMPDGVLGDFDPTRVKRPTALALLQQTSVEATELAAKALRVQWKGTATLQDKAALAREIAAATDMPALRPSEDLDAAAGFVDLLAQGNKWQMSAPIALRTDLLGQLTTTISAKSAKAANDDERLELMRAAAGLPTGRERNALLDELTSAKWSSAALLDQATNLYVPNPPASPQEWLLQASVAHFPQDPLRWVDFLTGRISADDIRDELGLGPSAKTDATLAEVRDTWSGRSPKAQRALVAGCIEGLLKGRGKGASPTELFDRLLDEHVLGALGGDADLGPWADTFAKMLRRLPADLRAEMIADVLLTPPEDALALMQTLIGHGGILATKAGQQLSEDPDVPGRIRTPLSDTLQDNEPLTPIQIWSRIPRFIRLKVDRLGPRLGTGSAKQAFLLDVKPGDDVPNDINGPLVGAVTLPHATSKLKAVLAAASAVPEVEYLLRNLAPVVTRELDLEKEAAAFELLANSKTGQSKAIRPLGVVMKHTDCIVREGFEGKTIHELAKTGALDKGAKARMKAMHRSFMLDAFDTSNMKPDDLTFVFTDPHLGNIADDGTNAYAFDPGQYARMKPAEADLFVGFLVASGSEELRGDMRAGLIAQLALHSKPIKGDTDERPIEQRLGAAYDHAMAEDTESVGHRLTLFLNECSKSGLDVPRGFFAGAKMMHILHGQARDFDLGDHIESTIRDLYVQQLGPWGKVKAWLKTR